MGGQRYRMAGIHWRRPHVQRGAPKDAPRAQELKLSLLLFALRLPRRGANICENRFPRTLSNRRLIAALELSYISRRTVR
jgi:hypothetical protein